MIRNKDYLDECVCQEKKIIGKALMKAQEELDVLEANAVNGGFKNKYARLVDIYNASKKALRKNGIFIKHAIDVVQDKHILINTLFHPESGEVVEDKRIITPEKPGSQGFGAAETYMKRYGLRSLLATDVGEDDDDGEAERIYLKTVQGLMDLISKYFDNPKLVHDNLLKHFNIKHRNEIGEHRLFEAACYLLEVLFQENNHIQ